MIIFNRVGCVAVGKMGPAMAFAREMCAHLKQAHGLDFKISVPVGGDPNRITWSVEYPDLAAMEAFLQAAAKDTQYQQLVTRSADFLINGSVTDHVWRRV